MIYILFLNIVWINFFDCIDMDCDGVKYVLIKDFDGILIGIFGGSVIFKVDYEWNGDLWRGLGNLLLCNKVLLVMIFVL